MQNRKSIWDIEDSGTTLINFCSTKQLIVSIEVDWVNSRITFFLNFTNLHPCIQYALFYNLIHYLKDQNIEMKLVSPGNGHSEEFHRVSQPVANLRHVHLAFPQPINPKLVMDILTFIYKYQKDMQLRLHFQKIYLDSEGFFERLTWNNFHDPKYHILNQQKFITHKSLETATKVLKEQDASSSKYLPSTVVIQNIFQDTIEKNSYLQTSIGANAIQSTNLVCDPVRAFAIKVGSESELSYFAAGLLSAAGVATALGSVALFTFLSKLHRKEDVSKKTLAPAPITKGRK
jgi:hypothetical protein